ncbi:hypothetical protein [Allorhizobium taibaishanense]|uniref:Uncharacterized protein n=1 Tax=Allorhizobium taibaishanense TaxID=887144 RepID=A0A1Q9A2M6_9HYPH|nr:hypothetical protein [Allorhizobium taibaishanense]MBB4005816.1 hypothetical protein [Allorhizobium taibaishanense]OLP48865.1 hypothetical protein BJF91_17165 [Allorhizobium taibaishanense]
MSDVMWSITEIAVRDGVSKAAISKAVKKMLESQPDTPVERGPQGQVMRLSLAHYDHYRARHINPAKASAPIRQIGADDRPPASGPLLPQSESFDEARRQKEWLAVGREKLRRQEECGQLVRKDSVDAAVRAIGAELQAIIRRLPNRADDIALAVSKEGVHGVRVALRQIAFEIGNEMADKLEAIASQAPDGDPLIEDEEG